MGRRRTGRRPGRSSPPSGAPGGTRPGGGGSLGASHDREEAVAAPRPEDYRAALRPPVAELYDVRAARRPVARLLDRFRRMEEERPRLRLLLLPSLPRAPDVNGGLVGPGGFISKIRLRPGELLLGSRGIPAYPGDSGIVFYLGHNEENLLYVAPLGAPPFQEPEWPYPISATSPSRTGGRWRCASSDRLALYRLRRA